MTDNLDSKALEVWDSKTAIEMITKDGMLDLKAVMSDPDWILKSTMTHTGISRGRSILTARGWINIAIELGEIKDPDTPANWIAWAKRKGYDTGHLESSDLKQPIVSELGSKKEHELHSLIEDIYKSLGSPKYNSIVWSALELDLEKRTYDKNEIIQEIEGDIIYWSSRRGIEQTMKRKTFDNFLSTLRNK